MTYSDNMVIAKSDYYKKVSLPSLGFKCCSVDTIAT